MAEKNYVKISKTQIMGQVFRIDNLKHILLEKQEKCNFII